MGISKTTKTNANTDAPARTAAMLAANPVAAKAWLDIMAESAGFLTDRLQKDLETQKALMACKNPAELMQVQAEFFNSAMKQYADHTTRFYTWMSKAAESTVKGARSGHSRDYDDIPL